MTFPRTLFLFLLAAAGLFAAPVSELLLINGDRITGEILSREAGKITLRNSLLGTVSLAETAVASTRQLASASPAPTTAAVAPAPGAVASTTTPASGAAPKLLPPLSFAQVLRDLKGSVEFGFNEQAGRTEAVTFSLRGDADYVRGDNSYHLAGRYFYGKYNGALQSDRRDTSFRWRHELAPRFFSQAASHHVVDHVKSIDFDLEQSAGLGWAAVKTDRQLLNLIAGATGQYRQAYGMQAGTIGFADLSQDYSFKFNQHFSLKQDSSVQYSPVGRTGYTQLNSLLVPVDDGATNYRLRFNIALQSKLSGHFSMNLRYEFERDNALHDRKLKTDERVSSTLGYSF
jgi:putative salt-induced outer membrane protein YdiY